MRPTEHRISRRQVLVGASAAAIVPSAHPTSAQTPQATPSLAAPAILVEPPVTRRDERFLLYAGPFPSGVEITIEATIVVNGATFGSSSATYTVSDLGFVNCSVDIPTDGSFDEPDAMGFIWAASSRGFFDSLLGPHEVREKRVIGA